MNLLKFVQYCHRASLLKKLTQVSNGFTTCLFVGLGVISTCLPAYAQLEVKGFADSYHAIRIESPNDFLSSRNRVRLEATTTLEQTYLFVSLNAVHNDIIEDETGLQLREAYFDYVSDGWDLRIGRQIIIWGKSDGLRITDIVSPSELTEFIARDFDDTRIPVDALKLRFLGEITNLELLWLPNFQEGILAESGTPWATSSLFSDEDNVEILEATTPEKKLENGEFGAKLSFYLPGIDLSISSFYTWTDFPAYYSEEKSDRLLIHQKYYRYGFLGIDLSAPVHEFVLRCDIAMYFNKPYEAQNLEGKPYKRNIINALMGLDWYPGNNWTVSGQISNNLILNHSEKIAERQHNWLATLSISKTLAHETIEISSFSYIGLQEIDLFNRSYIDVSMTDEFHLLSGFDLFLGNDGSFGQYQKNSELWLKAKYSF